MCALDYYVGGRLCESMHVGVLCPSRRLRRVSESIHMGVLRPSRRLRRECESIHVGVLRPSRRLRRVNLFTELVCGREIICVYAFGRIAPFEALAPSL